MDDLNPIDATVHAIVEALRADPDLAGVTFHKGWPANADFALPAIAVSAQRAEWTKDHGVYRVDEVDADTVDVFFVRARQQLPMQLDLWTKSKTERAELEPFVRKHFWPTVADDSIDEPPPPGLVLTIPHHDALVRVDVVDENRSDSGSEPNGYFRVEYSIDAEVPMLTKVRYSKAEFAATGLEVGADVNV
jgi:hypothetical protein